MYYWNRIRIPSCNLEREEGSSKLFHPFCCSRDRTEAEDDCPVLFSTDEEGGKDCFGDGIPDVL